MSKYNLAIILSIYNDEKYLVESLDSIRNSIVDTISTQVVIIDDGSTDSSYEIASAYCSEESWKIIKTKNSGLATALNIAISYCDAKYIVRMDSDDICILGRFEKLFGIMEANPDIDVLGSYVQVIGERSGLITHPLDDKKIKSKLVFEPSFVHPSVIIRSEILEDQSYNSSYSVAQDYRLWVDLAINNAKMANTDEVLLKYRVSNDNVTSKRRKDQILFAREARTILIQYYVPNLSDEEVEFFNYLCDGHQNGSQTSLLEKLEIIKKIFKGLVLSKDMDGIFITKMFIRKCIARTIQAL
ncbi:glycosyltransferase [Vibrio superstes]|uniref:Glycosyltransferase 2-like domain-containing protein n=1 Tax=Vibrio superstes NBRC 103154 TaxID=1219062 RepID=A0A511QTY5_9VIBR|nr:glycosyltransferase [Vibrio superstes]GEM80811.1 hypothetical protein VSU01S_30560 [Vibrio superstes NBRC 103154]